jgi:SAM-dependent methyltransferase
VSAIERLHGAVVFDRRVAVLADRIAPLLPRGARVLDIGAGDGTLASLLVERRPDLDVTGVDVLVRPETRIPVTQFDGLHAPFEDGAFDAALLVDVVHHADDPHRLLREARRLARQDVVIKDHTADGVLARPTLRFMDRVGNRRHGVALPYGYWTRREWDDALAGAGLRIESWNARLGLYPWPASLAFERSLHFVAALAPA